MENVFKSSSYTAFACGSLGLDSIFGLTEETAGAFPDSQTVIFVLETDCVESNTASMEQAATDGLIEFGIAKTEIIDIGISCGSVIVTAVFSSDAVAEKVKAAVEAGCELVGIVRSSSEELEALKPKDLVTNVDLTDKNAGAKVVEGIKGGPIDIVSKKREIDLSTVSLCR